MNVLTISKLRKVSIVPAPFGSSDCGNNSQVGFSPSRKLTSHLKLSLAVFYYFYYQVLGGVPAFQHISQPANSF